MVSPTSEELYIKLKQLVEDKQLRTNLAERGYATVKISFNLKKWEEKWTSVLKNKL